MSMMATKAQAQPSTPNPTPNLASNPTRAQGLTGRSAAMLLAKYGTYQAMGAAGKQTTWLPYATTGITMAGLHPPTPPLYVHI
jgi:hypothetical protein